MATKPSYQTPTVMRLGDVRRGAGTCTAGSGDVTICDVGTSASGIGCWSGPAATGWSCNVGDAASWTCIGGSGVAVP
jgi:hypothetical protein